MCPPPEDSIAASIEKPVTVESPTPNVIPPPPPMYKFLIGSLGLSTIALLVSTIVLASEKGKLSGDSSSAGTVTNGDDFLESKASSAFFATEDDNTCAGAKLAFENKLCADLDVPTPQAGANVTKGYVGELDMNGTVPNIKPYWQSGMCPVNVHWHLGSEHYSYGEFDENGYGPRGNIPRPDWANRDLASTGTSDELTGAAAYDGVEDNGGVHVVQDGFRCHHFDASDPKFTTPYNWKHCMGMVVGETYEVHWPHSAAGDCGTVNQYQTPFYDGVFCNLPLEAFMTLGAQDIANAVGVHGQVFTIVNDESYFYPDMIRGMIVDKEMGKDIHIYSGSTTGETRSNEMCSQYAPVTWQVDRKCHMISASSFDKMCYDMKMQRDNMIEDLHPHGSRELVKDELVANNQYYPDGVRKNLRA
ncbi:hypothetical protein ACHAW5_007362 [Stephanodiscus triporus]|uniref:Delta carbonic anhydrase n=1 Tax=Stephanodiscus triporus TaxID=2934178 RepID=A0ABD3NU64_9STRA